MALARDIVPGSAGIKPRGMHDFPDLAYYGHAALAQNVDFSSGWLRPRGGTIRVNRLVDDAGVLQRTSRIELAYEYNDHGSRLLLVVGRKHGASDVLQIMLDFPGNTTANPLYYTEISPCDFRRPTVCPWNVTYPGKLVLWVPISVPIAGVSGPSSLLSLVSAAPPYFEHHFPSGTQGASADEGVYRTATQQVPGEWGVVHKGRLVVGGHDGKLRYSSVADLYGWPTQNEINEFDGEPLTGGASFNGSLVVGTRSKVFIVDLEGQQVQTVRSLLQHTGIIHHNTVLQAARRLFWLSDGGLVALNESGQAEEVSTTIRETLRSYAHGFADASLIHHSAKHQLWLLIPCARAIFVMSLNSGDWSRYDWDRWDSVEPGALGLMRMAGIDYPICGARFHLPSGGTPHYDEGHVVAFEQPEAVGDWYFVQGVHIPRAWLSLPIMSLGHQQPRMYRRWRAVLQDRGASTGTAAPRFFWLTEGQQGGVLPAGQQLEYGSQYEDVSQRAPHVSRRWGDAVAWWNQATEAWPLGLSADEFAKRISLTGIHKGRWIQVGIRTRAAGSRFSVGRMELDARIYAGRR